ncbi:DBR1 domain-containing protein [Mycena chlorophos]|uniref:DBR1 domain-containing protein n=1 Tax=Mycena chlorophos TaxID=658473 RepID=A0A8H6TL35_MYCCL|nr:DBR1 domain-containing protein [Mycena chlorophos]
MTMPVCLSALHSLKQCSPFSFTLSSLLLSTFTTFCSLNMSTRAPPPGPGRFGFINRTYRTNLRPVVISVSAVSALWSLFACVCRSLSFLSFLTCSAEAYAPSPFRALRARLIPSKIGFFRSINVDKHDGASKLGTFAIILGAVYMGLLLVELLGVVAATLQRAGLVGAYAYASFGGILLALGGGVFQVVVHFTSKSDILRVCTDENTGDTFATYPFGFGGPTSHDTLNSTDALNWCTDEYNRASWQDIVSLLVTVLLWSAFSVMAWSYYRQVLDPTSVVNSSRAPANAYAMGYYNNRPYDASMSVPNLGYAAPYANPNPIYGPPPGPPPPRDGGKPADMPGYGADDKENPFADFDEPAQQPPHTAFERDVTSRPAPGGRDTFV